MKRKIFLTIISLLVFFGCGSYEQQSTVYINFESSGDVSKDTFGSTTMPIDAKEIIISVFKDSVNGKLLFRQSYARDLAVAEVTVDAGESRIFRVEAEDRNDIITYRGTSDPVDLVEGEITQVSITMEPVQLDTATISITLRYSGSDFNFASADLASNRVQVSVITLNSPIFDVTEEDEFEVSCSTVGDLHDAYYTNDPIVFTDIPAGAFIIVAARGYYTAVPTRISYIGVADPSQTSNLIADTTNDVIIDLEHGYTGSPTVLGNWNEYCLCGE